MKPLKDLIRRITLDGIETVFHRYYSRYPAKVIDNQEPDDSDGYQMLRLHIPLIHQIGVSRWVKGYGVPAGEGYGFQSLPRIGDWVYVTFEHGDVKKPRWNYGWYAKGEIPEEFKDKNVHGFKSPAGHSVLIDDTNDKITVTIKDGKTFMIDLNVIELNGNNKGGIPVAADVADKISNLETQVNNILTVLKTTTIPLAPTGTYPFAPLYASINSIAPTTTASDLENDKVQHGDN